MVNEVDVIIVGGRPSGSTLAARLGLAGLRVLLLERSVFPSAPGASMPIIYASTMRLLDEIGADEAAYARNTPKIRRMINLFEDESYTLHIPEAYGRDYAYGLDRARFDAALWNHALSIPGVQGEQGVSVSDLLWDGDRVIGVVAQKNRERYEYRAGLVIGADGRFSQVARKAGAAEFDEHTENPTSLYYAYWKNVPPYGDGEPVVVATGRGDGYGLLMMDSADGTVGVGVEGRADLLEFPAGGAESFYLSLLQEFPVIWQRLQFGERITGVHGMKRVGNLYRTPGGDGWALTGDAYHQKDPLDGQGIYDAIYISRALAHEIIAWKHGEKPWERALLDFDAAARAETFPQYQATLSRVRDNLYREMPAWMLELSKRTWMRWLFEDTVFQEKLGMMLTRQINANEAVSPAVMVAALVAGPLRELSRALDRQIQS
ncbi:MAG: NAD(P)/FAD-dependent oxidoreductase [bacterium]|nr:NAD(P)/FAD-dependent oxidoreductase [bacterium]